ncbi:MAG: hypothetical protein JNM02_00885 [Anaerolineales bacterium]|nr:hypothetical protein [Anaerolineales bacterium]
MKNESTQVQQRVMRYWYIDGLGELVGGGGVFFVLALYFSAQQYFGEDSLVGGLLQAGLFLILVGSFVFVRRLIASLKMRVTYPRTGYVEYRASRQNRILMGALAALSAAAMSGVIVLIVRSFDAIDTMVAMTGILVAVILLVKQVWSTRMPRFYFLGAISLILGGILSVSGFARGYNLGLFYGFMSIAFAVSGGITLKNYLRENPLPAEVEND